VINPASQVHSYRFLSLIPTDGRVKCSKTVKLHLIKRALLEFIMADTLSAQNNSNQTKIWTDKNIFAKGITFAPDQIFPVECLSYNNYSAGSILFANGNGWDVLRPSKNNQVLTFNARGLNWQTPTFSNIEGVLPVSKGGTGWSLFPESGILINTGKEMLDLMPIPNDKKILVGNQKNLQWFSFAEVANEISNSIKTIAVNGNDAIFEEYNPCFKLKEQQISAGLLLSQKDNNFFIGVNKNSLRTFNSNFNNAGLNFDFKNNLIYFEINNKKVFELDENNNLNNVSIDISQVNGILPLNQGGLGELRFLRGDIIFADSSKELKLLSTDKCEGFYLQVKDGIPVYAPLDKSGFDGRFEVPLILPSSKNEIAPLRFTRSKLIDKTFEGALEFDGKYLYLTNSEGRKALSFLSSNITGTASNVTGVVSIENGGTGQSLKDLAVGQILIKNNDIVSSFDQGSFGQVLMSQGAGSFPAWRDAILDIDTEINSGLILDRKEGLIKALIDQSINFNPAWQGIHTFIRPLNLKSKLNVSDEKSAPLNFGINQSVSDKTIGDIWFDGEYLNFFNGAQVINLSKPQNVQTQTNDFIQSHYLTLAAGADVSENRKIRMKTPVPHLTTKGSLANSNWKLRKLEILLDESAFEENAIFKLKCGNKTLIDQGIITVGTEQASFENFNEVVVSTGEILQLECLKTGGSNYWSAFLLIDLL